MKGGITLSVPERSLALSRGMSDNTIASHKRTAALFAFEWPLLESCCHSRCRSCCGPCECVQRIRRQCHIFNISKHYIIQLIGNVSDDEPMVRWSALRGPTVQLTLALGGVGGNQKASVGGPVDIDIVLDLSVKKKLCHEPIIGSNMNH